MGIERLHRTARVAPEVAEYIDDVRYSRWPHLTVSEAINLILNEHRLLNMAGILGSFSLGSQRGRCPQIPLETRTDSSGVSGADLPREVQKIA
jgi:hypothetical protein